MGRPKYALAFGAETLLERIVRVLSSVVAPIVVVAGQTQELPHFGSAVLIERDRLPGGGPLPAMELGLRRLQSTVDAAFVTGCDVPLLQPKFIAAMRDWLDGYDIAVCRDQTHCHPLQAVYRTGLVARIRRLLEVDQYGPRTLIEQSAVRFVSVEELRGVDPDRLSLRNVNTPADYAAALHLAGLTDST